MSRKVAFILLFLVLSIILAIVFLYSGQGSSHRILGKVTEVNADEFVVEGAIMSDSGIPEEKKQGRVELRIDDESELTKFLITPDSSYPVNEPYDPQSETKKGELSDLAPGLSVEVVTRGNIWRKNTAIVDRMSYYIINPK